MVRLCGERQLQEHEAEIDVQHQEAAVREADQNTVAPVSKRIIRDFIIRTNILETTKQLFMNRKPFVTESIM